MGHERFITDNQGKMLSCCICMKLVRVCTRVVVSEVSEVKTGKNERI